MRLRSRLALGTVALLAIAILVALTAAYLLVQRQLIAEVDKSLRTRATAIAAIASRPPPAGVRQRFPAKLPRAGFAEPEGYIQFVTNTGKVRLTPGEQIKLPADGAVAVATGRRHSFYVDQTVAGTHVRVYTARAGNGAVQVARSLTDVDNALAWIRVIFIAVSAIAIAATALLALLVARAALRPVATLTADAERIAATRDLTAQTNEGRSDELGRLARAFNVMLRALRESLSAQRQLVADASHELRTPLTTARTSLETLERHPELEIDERQSIIRRANRELEELTQLIDELVALARADREPRDLEPVRLDELTEEVVAVATRRTGGVFHLDLNPTMVQGVPDDLMRAIANLLDNAVKWSPPGSRIDVSVADGKVSVRDRGPGVAPEDRLHVFDRFYRAASARTLPGSGLGLAIVRQVAEAHGGNADVQAAAGGGSVFTLHLPVGSEEASTANGRVAPTRPTPVPPSFSL